MIDDKELNALAFDYTTEHGGDKTTRDGYIAGYKAAEAKSLERIERLRAALEECANLKDDETIKTTTDDDEIEYWVSVSQIEYIVDEALKDDGNE